MAGGNYELLHTTGSPSLESSGLEIVSTSNDDNKFGSAVGTSLACPTIASFASTIGSTIP